jgi:hypothetical protein
LTCRAGKIGIKKNRLAQLGHGPTTRPTIIRLTILRTVLAIVLPARLIVILIPPRPTPRRAKALVLR